MFPGTKSRNEGTFAKLPFCGTTLLFPLDLSQSPDLPLPHGLAPSETMVCHHGLNPPLSTENPKNDGFSRFGATIFGFGLSDPAPKG